jgi:hypothetical protein
MLPLENHTMKSTIHISLLLLASFAATRLDAALTEKQAEVCQQLGLDADEIAKLIDKPLYEFSESEVAAYLKYLSKAEPNLRQRIVHLARKNLGQPYELYLLGEMPFEPYDPQPLYCLTKSDCVVFAEHTYAMALSHNWPSFMKMLQRIRYRDGQIGVTTRNHYTEADWNISNRWLVKDITEQVACGHGVKFSQKIDRAKFFKNRYKLTVDVPVETHDDVYLPYDQIDRAKPFLREGDFVNIVRANVTTNANGEKVTSGGFVGHVGMVAHGENGEVHMIHSTVPEVREETFEQYIKRSLEASNKEDPDDKDAADKPRLVGFKFLSLRDAPLHCLRQIDGGGAPRVTLPSGDEAKF